MSVDQTHFQRDYIAHYDNGFSPVTTSSPPYTPVAESGPPHTFSPTTLSPAASISHRMHTVDEMPIQEAASSVSEFGQRSRSEPDTERSSTYPHPSPSSYSHVVTGLASEQRPSSRPSSRPRFPGSSASSLRLTPSSQPHSSRPSFEEERPEFLVGSSRSPLPTPPPSTTATQRSLSRSTDHRHHREGSSDLREHAEDARGRKHKRFTFANVSNALLDVVKRYELCGVDGQIR